MRCGPYGDINLHEVDINGKLYPSDAIRTSKREILLLEYAANYIDLFAEIANAENC